MIKRLMILVLALILLFGMAPLLSAVTASAIANMLGCGLAEGSVHTCVVAGIDIGRTLYTMFMLIWFSMMTIPFASLALLVWLIAAIILYVMHRRRRTF
jgi:hypothetical protein